MLIQWVSVDDIEPSNGIIWTFCGSSALAILNIVHQQNYEASLASWSDIVAFPSYCKASLTLCEASVKLLVSNWKIRRSSKIFFCLKNLNLAWSNRDSRFERNLIYRWFFQIFRLFCLGDSTNSKFIRNLPESKFGSTINGNFRDLCGFVQTI